MASYWIFNEINYERERASWASKVKGAAAAVSNHLGDNVMLL